MVTKNNPGEYDCYAAADEDEPMFILLGRDKHASALVMLWADIREREGEDPAKVIEARECAQLMAEEAEKRGKPVLSYEALKSFVRVMDGGLKPQPEQQQPSRAADQKPNDPYPSISGPASVPQARLPDIRLGDYVVTVRGTDIGKVERIIDPQPKSKDPDGEMIPAVEQHHVAIRFDQGRMVTLPMVNVRLATQEEIQSYFDPTNRVARRMAGIHRQV